MIFLFRFLHNHEENSWSKHMESIQILARDQKIKVEGLIYAKFSDNFEMYMKQTIIWEKHINR